MKKVLPLLFLLLPLAAFTQITVVDGDSIGFDIDTQASTTQYTGTWNPTTDIWYGRESDQKFYEYTLYEKETGNTLYSNTYPIFPWPINPPEVPWTETISQAEIIAGTEGAYTQLIPGNTYYLEVRAVAVMENLSLIHI